MKKFNTNKKYVALGLMSGTSLDGIDAAALICDGENIYEFLGGIYLPFENKFKLKLRELLIGNYDDIKNIEREFIQLNFQAITLLKEELKLDKIDIIGFHGQTIKHEPQNKLTKQIGDGNLLRSLIQVLVVYDFRSNDVKSGGQGAPFVPIFLKKVAEFKNLKDALFLNIGGICNICYCKSDDTLIAFDTGPGNAPLNDLMEKFKGLPFDDQGNLASSGTPNQSSIYKFLKHEFFKLSHPKSLDRNQFDYSFVNHLKLEDALATITHIIAHSIKIALDQLPNSFNKIIVSGGGLHNKFLTKTIEEICNLKVIPFEKLNVESDYVEAYAFAYLAVRSANNLPLSFPLTTGVKHPCLGGVVIK